VLQEFPQLAERTGARAHHLSGGEQQMLAIGRALMTNPDLILMDEPSEGLAPVLVRQLAGILDGLRRHGHSVLLVEQNVELALAAADHVYLLTSGRIVHEAPATQLRAAPDTLAHHLAIPTA
jgi:branched-chain amino acid transport system ATP-binding protein